MSLLQNPCSVCGLAILSGDSFIGTGDGTMKNGGSFAHDVCYYRREADALREELGGLVIVTKAERDRAEKERDALREENGRLRLDYESERKSCELAVGHWNRLEKELSTLKAENERLQYAIGEWKKEEVLWKDQEAKLREDRSDFFKRGYEAGIKQQNRFVSDLQKRRDELVEENQALKDRLFYLEAYFNTSHKEEK